MAIVQVEFQIELPDVDCEPEDVEEWLRFRLGDNGSMSCDNPLSDHEPEPIFGTFEWDYC